MEFSATEKIVLFGASRGLGFEVKKHLKEQTVFDFSRKSVHSIDVSREETWAGIISELKKIQPDRLFYFIGGGPYGKFESKEWKDHEWSWNVTFRFPAYLLHALLADRIDSLKQLVFTGSSVAENNPDPQAASYAAGKHALRGLLTSVWREHPPIDLRLFSPSYMSTAMLGAKAQLHVRDNLQRAIHPPQEVAAVFMNWVRKAKDAPYLVLPNDLAD